MGINTSGLIGIIALTTIATGADPIRAAGQGELPSIVEQARVAGLFFFEAASI
jgi:hypothetical protein